MERRRATYCGTCVTAVVMLAVSLAGLTTRAHGDTSAYDLLIEQSPAKAGTVTPTAGTHRFSADSTVTLSADPQPGYQFAYWLGDVTDPTSKRTTVLVNAPKIVVAVFEPQPEQRPEDEVKVSGGGGGALIPTATDLSTPGWSPSGGGRSKTTVVPVVVTPEPTTILLLALGTLALRRPGMKHHRRQRP